MAKFEFLTTDQLLKILDKHVFKQLHIHHTWKPTHRSFKGDNHIAMQQSMYNHHTKTNGWSDIAQHLTLFPDGLWLTGRPFNISPASIKGWNTGALCVEMVGNFDKIGQLPYNDLGYDELDGEQKRRILLLMRYFIDRYGEDSIKFHREGPGAGKTCPGTSLNKFAMIKEAKDIKLTSDKPITPPIKEEDKNIPSSWAKKDWEQAIKEGITDGTNPQGIPTREQVVSMIMRSRK